MCAFDYTTLFFLFRHDHHSWRVVAVSHNKKEKNRRTSTQLDTKGVFSVAVFFSDEKKNYKICAVKSDGRKESSCCRAAAWLWLGFSFPLWFYSKSKSRKIFLLHSKYERMPSRSELFMLVHIRNPFIVCCLRFDGLFPQYFHFYSFFDIIHLFELANKTRPHSDTGRTDPIVNREKIELSYSPKWFNVRWPLLPLQKAIRWWMRCQRETTTK